MLDEEFDDMSYDDLIQVTLKDLEDIEHIKKKRIIILAQKLEKLGTPKEMISQKISRDLLGRVNSSYVRLCLGEVYKNKKQVREKTTTQSRESTRADDGKKVLVNITNEGKQETANALPIPKEQYTSSNDNTVESLQNIISMVKQEGSLTAYKELSTNTQTATKRPDKSTQQHDELNKNAQSENNEEDYLEFEFFIPFDDVYEQLFRIKEDPICFRGVLDKRTGEVISAMVAESEQQNTITEKQA
jgi:hypothetical protein